ncbi:MAG: class I SAM-dependent methyltransferase [bacterium]|nr:class I SAM-dependent methyltransferase [bacterium]
MSSDPESLLRVRADDPAYRAQAEAEGRFWQNVHPFSLEAFEGHFGEGHADRYTNLRFTGDRAVPWCDVVVRYGPFHDGLALGTGELHVEARILESNPTLRLTFVDLSAGALARRERTLGARFPGRVTTRLADLNFLDLAPESLDVVVTSGTVHHVTNLEYLAFQLNRALRPRGHVFLQDYVGEKRFDFSPAKRRLYEILYDRELAHTPGRGRDVVWSDQSDLSPFCGVRSDEVLPVFRRFLDQIHLGTSGTLLVPLMRSRPAGAAGIIESASRWQILRGHLHRLVRGKRRSFQALVADRFLDELFLVGEAASDAGLVPPGTAFAIYRKRTG